MHIARSIAADHNDLIHDVAFDFYGKRLATCSSDQYVKVWDLDDTGKWHCTASWKTHSGSVWKVTWAHPEFGQVLATCSYDRTAAVWEELVADGTSGAGERGQRHWLKRTSLVDSRTSVTDVKFAPKHLGLMLATCSADGMVRVYEAPDVMNLSQWSLQSDINCKMSLSCISWADNSNRNQPSMLAVGSDDTSFSSGGKVHVYEYSEGSRRWSRVESVVNLTDAVHDLAFAPCVGRSHYLLGVAAKDVRILSIKPLQVDLKTGQQQQQQQDGTAARFETRQLGHFDDHNSLVWQVSWNIVGTILASTGDDGCVRLWKANYMGIWKCIATLQGEGMTLHPEKLATEEKQVVGTGMRFSTLSQVTHPPHVPRH
ncbi:nucleoporin SEH1-like [Ornithodoros turicata]